MRASVRYSRMARVLLAGAAAVLLMGSSATAVRYNDLGHKMMCVCGCNQILIECNHLGCPDSDRMLSELRADLAKGAGDTAILTAFEDKYGPTVLAAPMLTKFNIVAWIVPPLLLLLGIAGTVVLVRKWRRRIAAQPREAQPVQFQAMREKIRRETQL
jgi:cytochrome c-type biogenesis protein CcmH/NrfF